MTVKRYAAATPTARPRSLTSVVVVAAVAGVAMLLAAVLLIGPATSTDTAEAPSSRPAVAPAQARSAPAAAPQSEPTANTAVAAAARYLYELTVPALSDPERFDRVAARLSAPGRSETVRAAFGATDASVSRALGGRWRVLRSAPVGYRIERFTRGSASIALWTVTLAGSAQLPPQAQWRTLTMDLVWTDRGWRVAGGSGIGGPSPATSIELLAAEAHTFKVLRHAP